MTLEHTKNNNININRCIYIMIIYLIIGMALPVLAMFLIIQCLNPIQRRNYRNVMKKTHAK